MFQACRYTDALKKGKDANEAFSIIKADTENEYGVQLADDLLEVWKGQVVEAAKGMEHQHP